MILAKQTLDFLKRLDKNNNREWFQANKSAFEDANANVTELSTFLISELSKFDPDISGIEPKSCVFRIYRDIRFSKDKTPYKTNLGTYIAPGGRKSMMPGYYFHLQPGQSFIAGGKHLPDPGELLKIRNAIADNTGDVLKIVEKKSFRDMFGEMRSDKLKSAPKGFPPDHKAVEYLKLKEFMAFKELFDDKFLTGEEFPRFLVKQCREMYPLVKFLRTALKA